jgi:hypothetical protein
MPCCLRPEGEVFDLLVFEGRDLTNLALTERRDLVKAVKLRSPRIRVSEQFNNDDDNDNDTDNGKEHGNTRRSDDDGQYWSGSREGEERCHVVLVCVKGSECG